MTTRRSLALSASAAKANADGDVVDWRQAGAKQSLGYQVRYAYRTFVKALAQELAPHRITTSQWSALRVLWQDEGLSQVGLAQRMMVEKASLTSVLEAMESGGLIKRSRNAEDRRKINIFLTAAGRRLKEKLLPLGAQINKRATRGLSTAEVQQLRALLIKVMANLEA
jgi:DNA-binding MarR family transcriptional regulator